MSGYRPPRWLERMLEWAVPDGLSGQGTLGDLAEEFERRALDSPLRAGIWYAAQTVSIVGYRVFSRGESQRSRGDLDLIMDIRWSFRSIIKHPGFTLGVVAVLGLGLGANVAVFSVVDGTLRNTSSWSDPDATVRPMEPEDIPAVAELEKGAFDDPWPESAFHEMLAPKNRFNLVLTNGDSGPKGYLCAQFVADEIQIHNIAVAAHCRKRSYDQQLMRAAEA